MQSIDGAEVIESRDGNEKRWLLNGELQRVVYADGTTFWYENGELHREAGPAVEYADGYKAWYLSGMRHRADGPATEYTDGYREWWFNHRKYASIDEFCDAANITGAERTLFLLRWAT